MHSWQNLFTLLPLDFSWMQVLLFVTFASHLLFVLLVLGTTILGFGLFIKERIAGRDAEEKIAGRVMDSYLGSKSLAVVLGVGPLLIIQVLYYTGFFTSTGLFSYTWILIIPMLVVSFLCSEHFAQGIATGKYALFGTGLAGLLTLLTVPAVFTGVLALMERPEYWQQFAKSGIVPSDMFTAHWLLRYLHILGAALIIGGIYHLVRNPGRTTTATDGFRKLILTGIGIQIAVGLLLLLTIVDRLNLVSFIAVILAVFCTVLLLLLTLARENHYG